MAFSGHRIFFHTRASRLLPPPAIDAHATTPPLSSPSSPTDPITYLTISTTAAITAAADMQPTADEPSSSLSPPLHILTTISLSSSP
ncbi:hypothetical protein Tco_1058245 [Tanacetum coccineum]|uniref:Uncharacterized protein n=1 Tax=Tanacetum coccineum TaxID=301880 RepID=A0ABQ5H9U9_9ASTR